MDEQEVHVRWIAERHVGPEVDGFILQCMHCEFYIPLEGVLGMDWGVCTNPKSRYDRRACFGHDGCDKWIRGDQ